MHSINKISRDALLQRIGEGVSKYRSILGVSRRGLAKAIGVSEGSIRNVENNQLRDRLLREGDNLYLHRRQPNKTTLDALLRLKRLPQGLREDIQVLLDWEVSVLAGEIDEQQGPA